jgi:hypothetical protein
VLLLRLCAAVVLLLPPLMAGLGGEGRGWREATWLVFGGFRLRCSSATPPGLLRGALPCLRGGGGAGGVVDVVADSPCAW